MRRISSVLDARQLQQQRTRASSVLYSPIRRVSSLISIAGLGGGHVVGEGKDKARPGARQSSEMTPPCRQPALASLCKRTTGQKKETEEAPAPTAQREEEEEEDNVEREELRRERREGSCYRRHHRPAGRCRAALAALESDLSELGLKSADALSAAHVEIEAARDERRARSDETERLESELLQLKSAWEARSAGEEEAAAHPRLGSSDVQERHGGSSSFASNENRGPEPGAGGAAPASSENVWRRSSLCGRGATSFGRSLRRMSGPFTLGLGSDVGERRRRGSQGSSSSSEAELQRRLAALQGAKARNAAPLRARVSDLDAQLSTLERDVKSKQDRVRQYSTEAETLRTVRRREAEQCAEQRDMLRKRLSTLVERVQKKEARLAFADATFAERIDAPGQQTDPSSRMMLAMSGALCA